MDCSYVETSDVYSKFNLTRLPKFCDYLEITIQWVGEIAPKATGGRSSDQALRGLGVIRWIKYGGISWQD
jgi:hypothetical protein